MKVAQAVVQRIRQILDDKDITLYRLEKDSGLSKGTFLSLIYGKRKSVNLTTVMTIIQTLNITAKEFFDSPLFDESNLEID